MTSKIEDTGLTREDLIRARDALMNAKPADPLVYYHPDGRRFNADRGMEEILPRQILEAAGVEPTHLSQALEELEAAGGDPHNLVKPNRAMRRRNWHVKWRGRRTIVDRLNETVHFENGRYLHPTKGFRKLNPKRTFASDIVDRVKRGLIEYNVWQMKDNLAQIGENP